MVFHWKAATAGPPFADNILKSAELGWAYPSFDCDVIAGGEIQGTFVAGVVNNKDIQLNQGFQELGSCRHQSLDGLELLDRWLWMFYRFVWL